MSPSPQFTQASTYLRSATEKSPDTSTQLRLYALYKIVTTQLSLPLESSRPALWDFEGRAKWNSWKSVGLELQLVEEEDVTKRAEEAYIELARTLGWSESTPTTLGTIEDEDSFDVESSSRQTAMVHVSKMLNSNQNDDDDDDIESTTSLLHDLAFDGSTNQILTLHEQSQILPCINQLNSQGYAPIHLAADQGHLETVKVLLQLGAKKHQLDSDGLTPLDLAREARRHDMIEFLSS